MFVGVCTVLIVIIFVRHGGDDDDDVVPDLAKTLKPAIVYLSDLALGVMRDSAQTGRRGVSIGLL